jgi:hypothetical protein
MVIVKLTEQPPYDLGRLAERCQFDIGIYRATSDGRDWWFQALIVLQSTLDRWRNARVY